MIPGLGELPLPDSFPCPVCPADIGEVCEPDCYAGSARVLVFYMPYEEGKWLLENLRRYHLARAIDQVAAPLVPTAAEEPHASDAVTARKR